LEKKEIRTREGLDVNQMSLKKEWRGKNKRERDDLHFGGGRKEVEKSTDGSFCGRLPKKKHFSHKTKRVKEDRFFKVRKVAIVLPNREPGPRKS